ncbi:MAG: hypothetical protein WBN42_09680, partial [Ignavibacteriaceae bacterium]
MSGKATLLLIVGFSLIFLVVSRNFGITSTRAIDNYVDYYKKAVSHNIAVSGANIAANNIFLDPTWDASGYSNIDYQDGTISLDVQQIDPYKNIIEITAQGNYDGYIDTVKIKLAPSKFSKFAYYSVSEGGTIWWTGNDTVWGPFHTQDYMRAYRHPVFFGKATTKKKLIYYTSQSLDKPYFFGGYQDGVDLPLPADAVDNLEPIADDDGLKLSGHDTVYITFDRDSLRYRYSYNAKNTVVYLPAAAPNGLIFAKDCVVRLKGTVKGQYTLGCSTNLSAGKGTIYLDDNIVFDKDPRIYPTSSDLLGICAENSVYITENAANNSNIDIHGSIYC